MWRSRDSTEQEWFGLSDGVRQERLLRSGTPERVPTTLLLDEEVVTTTVGESLTPKVTVLDQSGEVMEIPDWAAPEWTVSSPDVIEPPIVVVGALSGGMSSRLFTEVPGRGLVQIRGCAPAARASRLPTPIEGFPGRSTDPRPLWRSPPGCPSRSDRHPGDRGRRRPVSGWAPGSCWPRTRSWCSTAISTPSKASG